ncbi:hypothetical protein ACH5RR_001878 [Cinchona calisaya]|uniref:Uncharacterized protein n=1 Tax=Cinchona calisaya TaxID=153742 RepID=A0ABD3B5X5_9GENT
MMQLTNILKGPSRTYHLVKSFGCSKYDVVQALCLTFKGPTTFEDDLDWVCCHWNINSFEDQPKRLAFAVMIYETWNAGNSAIFQLNSVSDFGIVDAVVNSVKCTVVSWGKSQKQEPTGNLLWRGLPQNCFEFFFTDVFLYKCSHLCCSFGIWSSTTSKVIDPQPNEAPFEENLVDAILNSKEQGEEGDEEISHMGLIPLLLEVEMDVIKCIGPAGAL